MKRFVSLTAITVWTSVAFSQGTITFNNGQDTVITWGPGWHLSGPVAASQGIKVGLYYLGPNGFTLVSPTPYLGTLSQGATNSAVNGRFNVGTITVPGLPAGQSGTFQLRAWSGGFSSFEAAYAGGALYGAIWPNFSNSSGGVLDPVTGLIGPPAALDLPVGLQIPIGFVPEPPTVALTAIGLCALVLLGRLGLGAKQ